MNATQLRKLGFTEAAAAAEAQQFEGDRARVYVEHMKKSPLDAPLCARIVDALEAESIRRGIVPQSVTIEEVEPLGDDKYTAFTDAYQPQRGAGCAGNSADEYSSDTEGHW